MPKKTFVFVWLPTALAGDDFVKSQRIEDALYRAIAEKGAIPQIFWRNSISKPSYCAMPQMPDGLDIETIIQSLEE